MTGTTVVVNPPSSEAETLEEIVVEAIEETNDSDDEELPEAVAVAAVEGETAVALAEIQASVDIARIEADREREGDLWNTMNRLEEENRELRTRIETMEALALSPPSSVLEETPLTETETEEIAEAVAEELTALESDLTPQSMSAPTNETPMEATLRKEGDAPEVPLIPPVVEIQDGPVRRVIRLV